LGIVVADIDKFKRINDNYNHAVGDRVIQHFAEVLKAHTTKEDCVFRSGGEEFTIS
ncbi:GGDEF domain-containing protein, partial [Leptospira santarosai]|nr:GGDEF domain-containing protein [Leptospira santarosai]